MGLLPMNPVELACMVFFAADEALVKYRTDRRATKGRLSEWTTDRKEDELIQARCRAQRVLQERAIEYGRQHGGV
jgi:hypothetical protein